MDIAQSLKLKIIWSSGSYFIAVLKVKKCLYLNIDLKILRLFCILPKLVHFPMCQFVCSVQRMFVCLVSPRQKATARQKRDQKIASLLILIVTVFGCCNILRLELYHKRKKYFHDSVSMLQCPYVVCLCHREKSTSQWTGDFWLKNVSPILAYL